MYIDNLWKIIIICDHTVLALFCLKRKRKRKRKKKNIYIYIFFGGETYSFSKNSSPYVIPSAYWIFLKWSTPCQLVQTNLIKWTMRSKINKRKKIKDRPVVTWGYAQDHKWFQQIWATIAGFQPREKEWEKSFKWNQIILGKIMKNLQYLDQGK